MADPPVTTPAPAATTPVDPPAATPVDPPAATTPAQAAAESGPAAAAPARTAWVTGASSGIGRATAARLLAQGWQVALTARRAHALAEVVAGVAARHGAAAADRALVVPADITDSDSLAAAQAQMAAAWGGAPQLAILNAGTYTRDAVLNLDLEAFSTQVEVNLVGTARCVAAVLPAMAARRSGHLVLVSSVAGYRGLPGSFAYGATKAALINMAECLWIEARPHAIKVQVVCPGFVRTPLTDRNAFPMPMRMELEPAAAALVRGLERDTFEIRFPWLFTALMNRLRGLPNRVYLPLIARSLGYRRPR